MDKYGNRVSVKDEQIKKQLEAEGKSKGGKDMENKYYDDDGKFKWEGESSSDA